MSRQYRTQALFLSFVKNMSNEYILCLRSRNFIFDAREEYLSALRSVHSLKSSSSSLCRMSFKASFFGSAVAVG